MEHEEGMFEDTPDESLDVKSNLEIIISDNTAVSDHHNTRSSAFRRANANPEQPMCVSNMNTETQQESENRKQDAIVAAVERFTSDINKVMKKNRNAGPVPEILEHLSKVMGLLVGLQTPEVKPLPSLTGVDRTVLTGVDPIVSRQPVSVSPDRAPPKSDKKRKRTKFTEEQVRKLEAAAKEANWIIGNVPKERQEQLAGEIGISMESLKCWFHNTKQKNLKKGNQN